MATPTSLEQGKDVWHAYVSKKTEAMPKNSLFGTALEKTNSKPVELIDSAVYEAQEMKERQEKFEQYEHKLPERLKNVRAAKILNHEKEILSGQEKQVTERQRLLADMESRARYFRSLPPSLNTNDQVSKKILLADPGLDFELTKKMNTVGYPEKNDYNREKNRVRPPVHKYAVIGDPLEYGMDFSLYHTETQEKYNAPKALGQQHIFHRNVVRDCPSTLAPRTRAPGEMPANIKAIYGSRLIDQLFSDKEAIDRVKRGLEAEREMLRKAHQKVELPAVEVQTPKNYGDLSHNLRQDKFSGYTFHKPTLMKETHTQEVFDRRYKDPDEYRHRWDEYGRWKSQEILRAEADKEFQEYLNSRVKIEPNWDRNAVAPRAKRPVEAPKEKRKRPKPKAPVKNKREPVFENVEFVTPPVTPEYLPANPPPIVLTTNKKDDDFWKFYDQGLPSIK